MDAWKIFGYSDLSTQCERNLICLFYYIYKVGVRDLNKTIVFSVKVNVQRNT